MARMRLTQNDSGSVTIRYRDEYGEDVEREFFCGSKTGYVREWTNNGNQVCERLSTLGSTLLASEKTLPAVIRREYRAMRRAERRFRSIYA